MFKRHSVKRAIIQAKLECRPASPAYSFVAGYAERYVSLVLKWFPRSED